jgi:hypothetical protein
MIVVVHPASNPVLDSFGKHKSSRSEGQDATQDYSESGPKVQVFRLWKHRMVGPRRGTKTARRSRYQSQPSHSGQKPWRAAGVKGGVVAEQREGSLDSGEHHG